MAHPLSLRSLAAKYSCSHELIRKIKSEGIDIQDEAAVMARISPDVPPTFPLTVPTANTETGLRAAIDRLRASEVAAHHDYQSALQNAPEQAPSRLKAWGAILDQLRKAEVENPYVEKENAATVSKEELAKVLGELFKNLRMDLDALPRKIGLSAGDKRDAVEMAVTEEKDRILTSLFSLVYLAAETH